MNYISTRDKTQRVTSAQAITQGISAEGGLFVPETLPKLSIDQIGALVHKSYVQRASTVLSEFLTDFTQEEIDACVTAAYGERFENEKIAPLSKLSPDTYMLELWHGPTCAFKDMALQLLPYLMTASAKKLGIEKTIVILVATSGDTGKAALEGFADVDGTKIAVFYPQNGVSPMQKRQMATQDGANVEVCAIEGNFDDAQNGVKAIFGDKEIAQELDDAGMMFSSANSINWGRLVPQIVYYISAYCDLVEDEEIALGDSINVVVPTGNFGNILAAYYAKKMGLPIAKLICASNSNNVLTDFIKTGVYDRNRAFKMTISPSMDILISSNLERLLFDLCSQDDTLIGDMMKQLSDTGVYTVPAEVAQQLGSLLYGGCCDDAQTKEEISRLFESYSYLCDTHTGVAMRVYREYVENTGDQTKTVVASTANPYKFVGSVLEAVDGDLSGDEYGQVSALCEATGAPIPASLAGLRGKVVRFTGCCEKSDMKQTVRAMLGL